MLARAGERALKRAFIIDGFIAFGLALCFTLLSVKVSLQGGRLSVPPTFDDISYFEDAARRLLTLQQEGLRDFLQGFITSPPHSPLVTCTSLAGFMLFGIQPWAPYLLNVIWLFLLLLGLRAAFTGLPRHAYLAAALATLAWPLAGYLVLEARPDIVCGFATAFSCLLILSGPWVGAPRRRILAAAVAASLALWAKPSILLVSFTLFGAACLLSTAVYFAERRSTTVSRSALVRPTALFFLATLLLSLPYYIVGWRSTLDYIYVNYVGAYKGVWIKATAVGGWRSGVYYLWGIGGHRSMGVWFFVTLALLATLAICNRRQLRAHMARLTAIAAWCLVAYLSVTIPAVKSPYLGIVVSCAVFFLFIAALRLLFTRLSPPVSAAAAAALVLLCATLFHWHVYYYTGGLTSLGNPALNARRLALVEQITNIIATRTPAGGIAYLPTATPYLNSSILQFALYQRHINTINIDNLAFSDDLQAHLVLIATASDIILPDPADPGLISYLPATSLMPAIAAAVKSDPSLHLVATLPAEDGLHHILIYRRAATH